MTETEFPGQVNEVELLDQNGQGAWPGSGNATLVIEANQTNVLSLTMQELNTIPHVNSQGQLSQNSPLVINIIDAGSVEFTPPNWGFLQGNQNSSHVLYNFVNATEVTQPADGRTVWGTLFAPNATFNDYSSGNIVGNVIVNSFNHGSGSAGNGGEVHAAFFNANIPVLTSASEVPVVDGQVTSQVRPVLTGLGAPNETLTVEIFLNDDANSLATFEVMTDEFGSWSIDTATQDPVAGSVNDFSDMDELRVTATNDSGNTGENITIIDLQAPGADSFVTGDESPTFTGMGEPGETVMVEICIPGEEHSATYEAVVDANGVWSIDTSIIESNEGAIPTYPDNTVLEVKVTDQAGNTGTGQVTTRLGAPEADSRTTSDFTPELTGRGVSGEILTVEVRLNDETDAFVTYQVTVDGDGNWSIDPETHPAVSGEFVTLNEGDELLVTAINEVGNSGDGVVVIDSEAPDVDNRGTVATLVPILSGEGRPGEVLTVEVCIDGHATEEATYTVTVGEDGTWLIDTATATPDSGSLGALVDGTLLQIKATDEAGNQAQAPLWLDLTPPEVDSEIINNTEPEFTGTGRVGEIIRLEVRVDGAEEPNAIYETVVNNNGTWSIDTTVVDPVEGELPTLTDNSVLDLFAIDEANNTGVGQEVVDLLGPIVNDNGIVTTERPVLSGQGEPGELLLIEVSLNGSTDVEFTYEVTVDENGNWEIPTELVPPLTGTLDNVIDGTELSVTATDPAGNSDTAPTIIDLTFPTASSFATNLLSPTLTGTGAPGEFLTVEVCIDGDTEHSTVYDVLVRQDGTWSINTATQTPLEGSLGILVDGNVLDVKATNAQGETGVGQVLIDTQVPTAESGFSNSQRPTITGAGRPGEKLCIEVRMSPDGDPVATYDVTVDENGMWSIDTATAEPIEGEIPELQHGDQLFITATDKAGNTPTVGTQLESNVAQNGYAVVTTFATNGTDIALGIYDLDGNAEANSAGELYDDAGNLLDGVDSSSNFDRVFEFTLDDFGGNQVFSIEFANDGSIYVGTWNNYTQQANETSPAEIYRIRPDGSEVDLLATLPGDSGIESIAFDAENNLLFASNAADNLIYTVDIDNGLGQTEGYATYAISADATHMNLRGIGFNAEESRLYYALSSDNGSFTDEIRSVAVGESGIDGASDILEFTITETDPAQNAAGVNHPISDIEFSQDGNTLLLAENPRGGSVEHTGRIYEANGSSGNWVLEPVDKHQAHEASPAGSPGAHGGGGVDFAFHSVSNSNEVNGIDDFLLASSGSLEDGQFGIQYQSIDGGAWNSSVKVNLVDTPVADVPEIAQAGTQLVFVDEGVSDFETLLADITAQHAGSPIEVYQISSDADGLQQIADFLNGREGIEAIHILSHSDTAGELKLGNNSISNAELQSTYANLLGLIGQSLTDDGDILIYGCDLASDAYGEEFVDSFAQLTGADVAASDDLTGHSTLNADWELEYTTGSIEADIAVSAEIQGNYEHILLTSDLPPAVDIDADDSGVNPGSFAIAEVTSASDTGETVAGTLGDGATVGASFNATRGVRLGVQDDIVVNVVGGTNDTISIALQDDATSPEANEAVRVAVNINPTTNTTITEWEFRPSLDVEMKAGSLTVFFEGEVTLHDPDNQVPVITTVIRSSLLTRSFSTMRSLPAMRLGGWKYAIHSVRLNSCLKAKTTALRLEHRRLKFRQ